MSGDLRQLLEAAIDQHHQADEWGYPVEDCCCGNDRDGTETWAAHLAFVISDLLIDLAGTGQLLASIDRLYRGGTGQETP
ncbi:hypothetical protein [Mycobacterium sp. 23]|uniref:hypothetical protein n=1 Tax=Mycobacterium sp. 23 TaxID=3400424 RepID=UPI003AABC384